MSDSTEHPPTSVTLNRAADLIQERGWKSGYGWVSDGDPADASLCLEGGVMAALGVSLPLRPLERADAMNEFYECPAYNAVMSYLKDDSRWNERSYSLEIGKAHAFDWNDVKGRTAAEVVEVLRAAAAIEESREATVAAGVAAVSS